MNYQMAEAHIHILPRVAQKSIHSFILFSSVSYLIDQSAYVRRVFHLSLRLITFGALSPI